MADLDFSGFDLTDEDLVGIDPNDLGILDRPIKLPEEKNQNLNKSGKILEHPDKFLFTAEEFLEGIRKNK